MDVRITPLTLREQYGLNISSLAVQAHVSPSVVYYFFTGTPVTQEEAESILLAISVLTGLEFTVKNVAVKLINDEGMPIEIV